MSEGLPAPGGPECYRHPGRETWIRCQRCDRPICPDCMRDATVGFQCPECVSRGLKETRSGQATYGGARSGDPRLTSMVLVALNAVVWLAITATGGAGSWLVTKLALMPVGKCMLEGSGSQYYQGVPSADVCSRIGDGAWAPGVADGAPWLLVTSMFTHIEIWHIAFNMLALWVLGPTLEAALGRLRFLAVYLGSGLVGSVAVLLLSDTGSLTVGASGSIFGLLAAHLVVGRKVGADLSQLGLWIGLNVVITVVWSDSISWQGHLGGFVGGALVTAGIVYSPKGPRRAVFQWGAVALVLLAAAVVAALRIAALQ